MNFGRELLAILAGVVVLLVVAGIVFLCANYEYVPVVVAILAGIGFCWLLGSAVMLIFGGRE